MSGTMRTIKDIIRDAGGARAVKEAANQRGCELTIWAPYKWQTEGVPDRHWPVLVDLAGATPEELYRANLALREGQQQSRVE
jgi:hypothetical protein